jgi:hypothetical protein
MRYFCEQHRGIFIGNTEGLSSGFFPSRFLKLEFLLSISAAGLRGLSSGFDHRKVVAKAAPGKKPPENPSV